MQFVISLLCATKMGPYYFGIWGFNLLLLNYMQQINFGIPYSANILLVQQRNNPERFSVIETTSIIAQSFLCIGVFVFAIGNVLWGYPFLEKYPIGSLFYIVCLTAMSAYMVQIFTIIYRVKHQLTEIAISQSVIPLLMFIAIFFVSGRDLLFWFTILYLIGYLVAFSIFLFRGKVSFKGIPSKTSFREVYSKGILLFIYNACFYLIILSTRTVVSSEYKVEELGFFTFAYTLADAVILLFAAIQFLLFPKAIEKLHSSNILQVKSTIELLRVNYMTLTHGLMYVAFVFFPVITWLIPKYSTTLTAIDMIALALIMNTTACGYIDYLMAHNKEKQLAKISFISLLINVILAVFMARIMKCQYEYIIVATIVSYSFFSLLCVILGKKQLGDTLSTISILSDCFPMRLLIPFFVSVLFVVFQQLWLLPLPLLSFILLNSTSFSSF